MDERERRRRRQQTGIFLDMVRLRNAADRHVERHLSARGLGGVTPAQANALMVIVEATQPLTGAELARHLCVSEVTVSRLVRKLESGGWVARARDPRDARRLLLKPTVRTRSALPSFAAVSNALLDTAFAGVDDEGIAALGHALAAVVARLEPGSHREGDRPDDEAHAGHRDEHRDDERGGDGQRPDLA